MVFTQNWTRALVAITWIDRQHDEPIHVSVAAGALTLSFGGHANLSFDGEGRLIGAWFDGITYRRALDNRVQMKWRKPEQPRQRQRRMLDRAARDAVLERAYAAAAHVERGLRRGFVDVGESEAGVVDAVVADLERIGGWSLERLAAETARFAAIYKPISILPPDQYLALVLQATEGCSYNECTFCTFYRDRPFRIKRAPEFRQHTAAVQAFLGRGRTVRKRLFLADANAVIIPQARLEPLLAIANEAFPIVPASATPAERQAWMARHPWSLDGIYAFVSAPDALHKEARDFASMRAQNLRRLYVGLESGHDALRAFLRKQGAAADVCSAVARIKAGGLSVGLIFMAGVGGHDFRDAHFNDTVGLIQRLPLGPDDLIYVSPFVAGDESPYQEAAQGAGVRPLDEAAVSVEEERFRHALQPWARARGVRISRYDIREFLY